MHKTKLSKNGKPLGRPRKTVAAATQTVQDKKSNFAKAFNVDNIAKTFKTWSDSAQLGGKKITLGEFPSVMDYKTGELIPAKNIIDRYRSGAIQSAALSNARLALDQSEQMALDNLPPPMYGNNLDVNLNQINSLLVDNVFLGYAEYSLLAQNSIMSVLINGFAEEMNRKWIKFYSKSGNKNAEEKIKKIEEEFERLKVRKTLLWGTKVALFQGGCLVNYKIKNDEKNNELAKPLNLNKAKLNKGDLEYISIIEPSWYVPIHFNTWDPRAQMFYEVDMYSIFGVSCHYTRITKMVYRRVMNLITPTYNFNGVPLAQLLIPHIKRFEAALDETINIISRLNLSVLSTSLEALLNMDMTEIATDTSLANRLKVFNYLRNNLGVLAIDKESEDFKQVTMSLAGLDVLLSQFLEMCAMIAQIPVAKAFGQSPKGLNATGEYDQKNYYDTIMTRKIEMWTETIDRLNQLAQINISGEFDEDIGWEWEKLEETNRLEDSQILLNLSQVAVNYIDRGVITAVEEQKRLAADKDSPYNEIEIEEKDITHEGEYQDGENENEEE